MNTDELTASYTKPLVFLMKEGGQEVDFERGMVGSKDLVWARYNAYHIMHGEDGFTYIPMPVPLGGDLTRDEVVDRFRDSNNIAVEPIIEFNEGLQRVYDVIAEREAAA